jgi:hypothetical protein
MIRKQLVEPNYHRFKELEAKLNLRLTLRTELREKEMLCRER